LAYLLAGAGVAGFACLALMYGLEMDSVGAHVFGPLSDLGTPVWNLLLVPLLLTFYPLLKVTLFGRALTAITIVLAVAGAGSSALLVTKTLTFAISTPITILGVLVQGLWLFTLTMRLRAVPAWPRWILRLGLFIPVAQAIGAAFVGISLGFGWGSVPQVAIMAIGLVAGVPAWAAWPVWFLLIGRFLARSDDSTAAAGLDHQAGTRALCYVLAPLVGAEVILVALMYAIEIPTGNAPLLGPLSDIAGLVVGFLIAPLVWALSRPTLTSLPGRVLTWAVIGVSLAAAVGTALMIVGVAAFGVSAGISVASYLLQTVWLLRLAGRWNSLRVENSLVRLSRLIGWASLVGAALAASSLAFGWGTAPQIATMTSGSCQAWRRTPPGQPGSLSSAGSCARAPPSRSGPDRSDRLIAGDGRDFSEVGPLTRHLRSRGQDFCCVVGKSACYRTYVLLE
jgi:hypothetical protein